MSSMLRHLLIALVLELAAFGVLAFSYEADSALATFAGFHLLASAVLASVVWLSLPFKYRRPRRPTWLFLTAFCFFIPGLAFIALTVLALCAHYFGFGMRHEAVVDLRLPEYFGGAAAPPPSYGPGGIRARLFGTNISATNRMQALLSLQALPAQSANALWRTLLSDRMDDIRLIAYGTLDAREKRLHREILAIERKRDACRSDNTRALLTKQLAELNWDMLYLGLAQGAVADLIRDKVKGYAQEALQADPADADTWLLLGRLALIDGDAAAAQSAFGKSIELGLPHVRTVPYLAELAFRRGDYATTRELMRAVLVSDYPPNLQPLAAMWWGERLA
jgi:tetratricopeptide (TPR) repeat protein